jgi:hypothetical protein
MMSYAALCFGRRSRSLGAVCNGVLALNIPNGTDYVAVGAVVPCEHSFQHLIECCPAFLLEVACTLP